MSDFFILHAVPEVTLYVHHTLLMVTAVLTEPVDLLGTADDAEGLDFWKLEYRMAGEKEYTASTIPEATNSFPWKETAEYGIICMTGTETSGHSQTKQDRRKTATAMMRMAVYSREQRAK